MAYDSSNQTEEQKVQEIITKVKSAFTSNERQNVETQWKELAEFVVPSLDSRFLQDMSKGIKRDQSRFDITAPLACRDLASAMHSTITNPASNWSKLRFRKTLLNDDKNGMLWLEHANSEIHNYLNDSSFSRQVGKGYLSIAGLGTMVLFHGEKTENLVFEGMDFDCWHLSETAFSENRFGIVDTFYRRFKLSLKKAYEIFGEDIGEDAMKCMEKKPDEEWEFYMYICPRKYEDIKQGITDAKHRPFACYYVMAKGKKLLREEGYYEFPIYVPRWTTLPGETYGYGPGHIAIADVLTLNTIKRTMLKGLAKAVDPMVFTEENNIISGDMRPGRQTVVRNIQGIKEAVTQSRFDIGFIEEKALEDKIKQAFYIDKLMLPPRTETGEMTAYEIQTRLEQMQVVLGPALANLNTELGQPLIMRSLNILMRQGKIDPIPQSVLEKLGGSSDVDLDIAFVNSLARSQQASESRNILAWLQETQAVATVKPQVVDMIDEDATVEKLSRLRDIPEELIRSSEEVAKIRDDRNKAMQMQQMLAAGQQVGGIAKDMAQAKNSGGSIQ